MGFVLAVCVCALVHLLCWWRVLWVLGGWVAACLGGGCSFLFAASAFRKLSSIYVLSYFPFGFEGRIWDLIVSVPDHCLYFLLCPMF